jgi:tetratricopeptide (TPR) repeat protein
MGRYEPVSSAKKEVSPMRVIIPALLAAALFALIVSDRAAAAEISTKYKRIVADFRHVSRTGNPATRAAAGRLARDAYRGLLAETGDDDKLDADDLHALGACHEALGQFDQAKELYYNSQAQQDTAENRLGLVRVLLVSDLDQAEEHYASARQLQPDNARLAAYRDILAAAHQRHRNWDRAIEHVELYLAYVKTQLDKQANNVALRSRYESVQSRLDRLRLLSGMKGDAAPELTAKAWITGPSTTLDQLRGKVVLVDFCALWSAESRQRIEVLKKLASEYGDEGLEVVGVAMQTGRRWDPATDQFRFDAGLSAKEEQTGFTAFVRKHDIPYRLAVIDEATSDSYGVSTVPHTVALDKQGNVQMILRGGDAEDEAELEKTVKTLLRLR